VAITEGTQPTPVHPTGTTATTGAFTPEANSLLVALVAADGTSTATTTASLSDSLSGSWTLLKRQNSINSGAPGDLGGTAEVWIRDIGSSPASMTVTASGWASNAGNLTVRTLIGALPVAQQTGATGGAGGGSIAPTATVTPNSDGSRIYGAALDYTTNATLTANAATTSIDQFVDGTNGDTWATFKGSADTAAGVGQTVGYTNGNAAYNIAAAEILAAATVGNDAPQPMMAPPVIALPWLRAPWMRQQAINGVDVPSAQTFTQSFDGSVTPSGALAKAVTKPGLAGSSTPTGALAKQVNKALAGSVTPTGVLTTVKVVLRSFAGSVTPTGALAKLVSKPLSGASTPTGKLTRQVAKALAGSVTPSGALAKLIAKALAGSVTPTGVLTTTRVILRSFAGSVTPTGVLARQAQKALAGSSTPRGTLVKAVTKALAGSVSAVGSLAKLVAKPFAGRSTPTGTLTATNQGATQNATSTDAVTAAYTSTDTATAGRTSTAGISAGRTSTSGVSASRTSTSSTTAGRTSSPDVSDG
jgi:hypothetical protein